MRNFIATWFIWLLIILATSNIALDMVRYLRGETDVIRSIILWLAAGFIYTLATYFYKSVRIR